MNIDFLRPAIGDDLFEQVYEKLKDAKGITLVNTADGSYVPKSKFDDERNVSKGYKAQIDELNGKLTQLQEAASAAEKLKEQIASLQEAANGNEELKKQIVQMQEAVAGTDKLKEQLAQLQADIVAKDEAMKNQKLQFAIRDGARNAKAKNPDIVVKMIDTSKITENNGQYAGLNEQFEALKASDAYLFEGEKEPDQPPAGGVDPHNEPDPGAPGSNESLNAMIRHAAGW